MDLVELEVVDNDQLEEENEDTQENENTQENGNTQQNENTQENSGENTSYQQKSKEEKDQEEEELKNKNDEIDDDRLGTIEKPPNDVETNDEETNDEETALNKLNFDYLRVIFIDLIFVSVGFFFYIFTAISWIVLLFFGFGLVIGGSIEYIRYRKENKANENADNNNDENIAEGYNLDEEFEYEWNENKQDDGIYVKTDFTNRYFEKYQSEDSGQKKNQRRKVSVTGSTRVYHKKNNGALMLEKRALYIFEDYKGYEIGGGLSSLSGFIITAIWQIIKFFIKNSSDSGSDTAENIFIIILVTAAAACIGCVIEIQLRKSNILPPNKELFSTSTSIALHEIVSIDSYSIGYHQNVKANLNKQSTSKLLIQKIAIKWFQCIVGIWKLFRFIFVAFYINAAFVLFIVLSIIIALQFEFAISKPQESGIDIAIMVMLWICFLLGIFAIFLTSQAWTKCCNDKELNRISMEGRLTKKKQLCLFILFIITTVLLFLSSIMMSVVVSNINDIDIETNEADTQVNTRLYASIVCEEPWLSGQDDDDQNNTFTSPNTVDTLIPTPSPFFNSTSSRNVVDTRTTTTKTSKDDLCSDENIGLVLTTLIFLCITWYLMLIAAYYWRKYDRGLFTLSFLRNDKANKYIRKWKQYSAIKIGLKKKTKSALFWSNSQDTVIIELDKKNALILHKYLNNVVPWFSKQHNVVTRHSYQYQI